MRGGKRGIKLGCKLIRSEREQLRDLAGIKMQGMEFAKYTVSYRRNKHVLFKWKFKLVSFPLLFLSTIR